jgi:hypothetical protein
MGQKKQVYGPKMRVILTDVILKKTLYIFIALLFFSGAGCRSKNNNKGRKETGNSDSIFVDEPSGILLVKSYVNQEHGYSINYPANWYTYEYKNFGGTDFFGHFETPPGNDEMSDLGITIYQKDEPGTLDEFYQNYITQVKDSKLLSDIKVENNMSFVYQGKYKVYSFLFTAKSSGTFDTKVNMFIEKKDEIYHLTGLLSPKYPTKSLQLYLEIMTTIQFLK